MVFKITLEAARVNARLTQKEAAKKVNVSNKTLSKWENGESFPPVDKAEALCELYGIGMDYVNFLPTNSL